MSAQPPAPAPPRAAHKLGDAAAVMGILYPGHATGVAGHAAPAARWPATARPPAARPPAARPPVAPAPTPAPAAGRRRALVVGINYVGTPAELRGCVDDAQAVAALCAQRGYSEVCVLYDGAWAPGGPDLPPLPAGGPRDRCPSRANILAGLEWLIAGSAAGDRHLFHYSGHGTQVADADGDEPDGLDEALAPLDYAANGMITDDELRARLVAPLAGRGALRAILDCCHSGSGFDLPYTLRDATDLLAPGRSAEKVVLALHVGRAALAAKGPAADVILVSGCADDQTAADAVFNRRANGALTYHLLAFLAACPAPGVADLLSAVRRRLRTGGYTQVPQVSSAAPLAPTAAFDL